MDPNSKVKENDDLILHYQGSILEMYKEKAQLHDETEIEDSTEMINASQGMLKDACVQCEFWVKRRDEEHGGIPKMAALSSLTKSSNEDISPLTTSSVAKGKAVRYLTSRMVWKIVVLAVKTNLYLISFISFNHFSY